MAIDRRGGLAPLLLAPGEFSLGLGELAQLLFPFDFESSGDQPVLGIDRAVAPFGALSLIAVPLHLPPPLCQNLVVLGLKLVSRGQGCVDRGWLDRLEHAVGNGLIDIHTTDTETMATTTSNHGRVATKITGRGTVAVIMGA